MSDERLRQAERSFRETGSVEDEARYLLERVRAGTLTRERLELAAYCGHEASKLAAGGPSATSEPVKITTTVRWPDGREEQDVRFVPGQSELYGWLAPFPRPFFRRLALLCARHVSPAWPEFFPDSPVSPASVLDLADGLLDGTIGAAAVEERLVREIAALDAEQERRGDEVAWTDGERAIVAARAAVEAACFVVDSLHVDPLPRVQVVAWHAVPAVGEGGRTGRGWQKLFTALRSAVASWAIQ